MKILMPFWQLETFARYVPQMRAISERIDEFHIAYIMGKLAEDWREYFEFHKVSIPYSFIRSITVRWWLSKGRMYEQIKDIDVDSYYTLSDFWSQEVVRHTALELAKPYVVRLRGNHEIEREAKNVSFYKRKFFHYFETRSLKDADLIVPISRKLANVAMRWGVHENQVSDPVPLGVDVNHFKETNIRRSSQFTVGYAGRISPEKGIRRLIELAKKLPNALFLVAGRKQMEISFPKNVRYIGDLPFDEMPCFYNQCDLVILPSLTEGFPCAILEAYACGKPILATPEAVPEELRVFGAVGDVNAFPELIKEIQTWSLQSLGKETREYVEKHYTWEKFGRSIVGHLRRVVA
jgi:glycosyltransferase involved in cell wall biosynthesis